MIDHCVDTESLSKFTASIFDKHKNTNGKYMNDYLLIDNNIISARNDNLEDTVDDDNTDNHSPIVVDSITKSEEVDIDVDNGLGTKSVRVKKVRITSLLLVMY